MIAPLPRFSSFALIAFALASITGLAQDTRTVTEPAIPASCTVLPAQQAIVNSEPASETTPDTSRLQSALNTCTAGQAVELATSGTNNAFLIGPITVPTGVTLLVDGGVTVFGSRNPADYQVTTAGVETCGTVGTAGNGCQALITMNSSNAAIMGYGIIDGRGQDKLIQNGVVASYSWWDNAGNAQLKSGGAQNNPILVSASAANLVFYKITVRNSPMFHIKWSGNLTTKTGFTAWGVKVITPFSARNSDGIDPSGLNISVLNSSISDGDDDIAVSASNPAQNITINNIATYSGHGISIGSGTKGGLTNMLVTNITQMGTATDSNGIGLRIKAQQSNGGLVQNVTYQNVCSANNKQSIYVSPYYSTSAGTSYPSLENITFRNIHFLTEGALTFEGYRNSTATVINPTSLTFDNVVFDVTKPTDITPAPADLAITLGPGPVAPLLTTLSGTNITYTGSVTNPSETPYPCSANNFEYIVGELYASTSTATSLHAATLNAPTSVTLNAMLQPAMSQVTYASISGGGTYTGMPAPTAPIQFLEGSTVVGTGTLSGNGTIASATLTGVLPGTHTYTAFYPGDATYINPLSFGTVTVTVVGVPSTTTAAVTGSLVYGSSTSIKATVASTTTGTPTGSVQFLDGATVLATLPLASGTVTYNTSTLLAGPHSFSVAYLGDTTFATSSSAAIPAVIAQSPSTTSVAASTTAINPGGSTLLSITVSGVSGALTPTGTVTVTNGSSSIAAGPLTAGKLTATVTLPSLGVQNLSVVYSGDANYTTSNTIVPIYVVPPFVVSSTVSTVSLSAGGSTSASFSVLPGGGFTGSVALTCTSPVAFITCTLSPASVTISGATAVQTSATISVAANVGSLHNSPSSRGTAWLAIMLPLGIFGFARRKRLGGQCSLLLALLVLFTAGATGCSNSVTPSTLPPIGSQTITVTGTSAGTTSTGQVYVVVLN